MKYTENVTIQIGLYEVTWDGGDNTGIQVASGIYIYRIQAEDFTDVKKLMLLR